jgi:UDP-N-acetylglucosamine--N-acetylmuramyl-(pentapeptide) pyrophosphoryl-undecaprenol N-acetylglucosamine transferase
MNQPTVLFAGGGTGGHLFPNMAVVQRLRRYAPELNVHFICSNRPLDSQILQKTGMPWTPLTVRPLPRRPWHVPGFLMAYRRSRQTVEQLIRSHNVVAMVATGGFVSGPAISAARKAKVPTVLVNLDAVPGRANRWLAGRCTKVMSVYATSQLPARTQLVAMPLRESCLAPADSAGCRRRMGLDPHRLVLLITAGSQGADSINRMMIALAQQPECAAVLRKWTIVHLTGRERDDEVKAAYDAAGLTSRVMAFSDEMGLCWGAASLAISRAGASSVAEVAANGVPAVFLPYPWHKDQHQRLNAQPLVEAEAALMWEDQKDGVVNAQRLGPGLMSLLVDGTLRQRMRENLKGLAGGDGAKRVAQEIVSLIHGG